ncbi:acyl-CoA synthetase ACTT5 [Parastagonospora nodorum]|nr:acyl-CoA synthetase ACTT5 [Parastagonospora nodorum]KAH4177107.1 acyl-CoA synthetase ACTT5 [Parastagonospora nodorum]KAH4341096.1 acyl-CoA synthetase ACTT5 [Parastagonospora nodorum]KAH4385099.1 acyl-CoA synthetase ACTT5 [Parastagonospora nodorum]KAH4398843.1 acyl-CoA synthetase ACTT5 [Parastagonospora nodorum]
MPWLSQESYPLPEEDLVSFAFGNTDYDNDKLVYHDAENESRTLSRRQGLSIVQKLVAGFRKAGLQKGDCFAITSFNDIMYPMVFLGGVAAGGVFSGTNPAYRVAEMRHHIRTAEVKFFIVEPELLDVVAEGATAEGIPKDRIFIFNVRGQKVPDGYRSWEWLLEHGEEDWERITDLETLKTTDVARLTTSGTTGLPKTACQSHYNATSWHTMTATKSQESITWEPRGISPLPLFHVATVPSIHASPFRTGHPVWIMRRFELEPFLAGIEKHQVTNLGVVPPLVIAIINSPLSKKYSLKSIRTAAVGAAPLDAGSQRRLRKLLAPDATFTQVWGMTETTSAITLFYYPEADDTGSVGRLMANTDVKLVDDDGKDITAYDVRGELCVRGPTVARQYYKNPKATAETWDEDGYLHSGDILYCDSKTKLWYIVDRKKELIKVRGFQVAPPELEAVLLEAKDHIVDAAVIGLKAKPGSDAERPRAHVVRKPGSDITEDGVKRLISENLASYKQLTGGVVFLDEVPKSPSGKILKRVLKEWAEAEEKEGRSKL